MQKRMIMKPLKSAPRNMILLLSTSVVVLVIQPLLYAQSLVALWKPALIAVIATSALLGFRWAAITIKFLYLFFGVALLLSLFSSRPMSEIPVVRRIATAILLWAVALYLSKSTAVKMFYNE